MPSTSQAPQWVSIPVRSITPNSTSFHRKPGVWSLETSTEELLTYHSFHSSTSNLTLGLWEEKSEAKGCSPYLEVLVGMGCDTYLYPLNDLVLRKMPKG